VPGAQRTGRQRQVGVERLDLEPSSSQPLQARADDPLVIGVHPHTRRRPRALRCGEHTTGDQRLDIGAGALSIKNQKSGLLTAWASW
jgi:hypothetical protein